MTDVTELFRTVGMVDVKADITGMTGDLGEIVVGWASDTDELMVSVDGGSTWQAVGAGSDAFEDLTTTETDTSLRAAPDGAGGVEWVSQAAAAGLILVDGGNVSYDTTTGVEVTVSTPWGINGSGEAYYNAAGATAGEEAALFWNPTTHAYVVVPYEF